MFDMGARMRGRRGNSVTEPHEWRGGIGIRSDGTRSGTTRVPAGPSTSRTRERPDRPAPGRCESPNSCGCRRRAGRPDAPDAGRASHRTPGADRRPTPRPGGARAAGCADRSPHRRRPRPKKAAPTRPGRATRGRHTPPAPPPAPTPVRAPARRCAPASRAASRSSVAESRARPPRIAGRSSYLKPALKVCDPQPRERPRALAVGPGQHLRALASCSPPGSA